MNLSDMLEGLRKTVMDKPIEQSIAERQAALQDRRKFIEASKAQATPEAIEAALTEMYEAAKKVTTADEALMFVGRCLSSLERISSARTVLLQFESDRESLRKLEVLKAQQDEAKAAATRSAAGTQGEDEAANT